MKKILSTLLVGALVLGMAPAVGLFAGAAETINTADEFIAFADALNGGTWNGGDVTVAADLDFDGKEYNPIGKLTVNIDFGGHTVKNLDVDTTITAIVGDHAGSDYYNNWHCTAAGLLANYVQGGKSIQNVTIKDSSLTVTADGLNVDVGGVVGTSDRGYVSNVAMDGVEITTTSTGKVGSIMGCQMWDCVSGADIALTDSTIDVSIDAPNALVGVLAGHANDNFDYAMSNVTINANVVAAASGMITEETIVANGNATGTAENATITVSGDGIDEEEVKIEESLVTIDTPEELALLASRLNEKGKEYKAGETIKVTADLDMKGVNYTPMKDVKFVLDFDGHTVSNLEVTVEGSDNAGLIAISLINNPQGEILNLKLKDCKLTANDAKNVGGVVGYADRGAVDNVTLENVTIKADAAEFVGGVIGKKDWASARTDMSAILTNVTIDAAETTAVGMLVGSLSGDTAYGAAKINVTGLTVKGFTVVDATMVAKDAVIGKNAITVAAADVEKGVTAESHLTYAEDVKISIDLDGDGTGNDDGTGDGDGTGDEPIDDGFATISTPEEFVAFVDAINAGTFVPSGTITVTEDLDMSGFDFYPIDNMPNFTLDFDGHTISNLVVYQYWNESAGLLVNWMSNGAQIKNLKLDTCLLDTAGINVGIVAGTADRGSVTNVEMKNITVYAPDAYLVGGVIGDKQWLSSDSNMSVVMEDVLIYAPDAEWIGLLAGRMGGNTEWGAAEINVTGINATNVQIINNYSSELYDVGLVGCEIVEGKENGKQSWEDFLHYSVDSTFKQAGETTGYCVDGHLAFVWNDIYVDADGVVGYTFCWRCSVTLDEGEAIGPQTKYEAEDAMVWGTIDDNADASGGKSVGNIGGPDDGGIAFDIYAVEGGKYTLKIYYIQDADRSMKLTVNDEDPIIVQLANGHSWSVPAADPYEIEVELEEGYNCISIVGPGEAAYAPNIDYIEFAAIVDDGGDNGEQVPGDGNDDGENVPGDGNDDGEQVPGDGNDDGEQVPGDGNDDGEQVPGDGDDKKDDASTDDKKGDASTDDKKDDTSTDDKKDDTTSTDKKDEDKKPAKTGDATIFAIALATIALAGTAVVIKKRHTAE